jgi:hypothetical protein
VVTGCFTCGYWPFHLWLLLFTCGYWPFHLWLLVKFTCGYWYVPKESPDTCRGSLFYAFTCSTSFILVNSIS